MPVISRVRQTREAVFTGQPRKVTALLYVRGTLTEARALHASKASKGDLNTSSFYLLEGNERWLLQGQLTMEAFARQTSQTSQTSSLAQEEASEPFHVSCLPKPARQVFLLRSIPIQQIR